MTWPGHLVSMYKFVCESVCVHHGNLFGVESTVSGLMRMCVWAGGDVQPPTPWATGFPRPQ